jgi:hypothetical protein
VSRGDPLLLDILGTRFEVRCDDDHWLEFMARLWEPFVVHVGQPEDVVLSVVAEARGWRFMFSDKWGVISADPWALANEMRNAMLQEAVSQGREVVPLHAAVAVREGSGLLLAGPPAVGKSTLVLALLERGWSYVSDDLAPICADSGLVRSFPKPVHVKDSASWYRYRSLWNPPGWLPPPTVSFLVPATALACWDQQWVQPRYVAFPCYNPTAPESLTILSAAAAAARSGSQCLRASGVAGGKTLGALARLCGRADSAALVYRSRAGALRLIEEWLAGLADRE